jgi:hypothetical protein
MATIGSTSWKQRGFRRLVMYIYSDKGRMENDRSFPPIYHNIPGTIPEAAIAALEKCSERRTAKRKDAVSMTHEWISFHPQDRPTVQELESLAQKWIELRSNGQDVVCFARAHLHTKALHIHFAFSGTDLRGKALRLSYEDFFRIRQEHEKFQTEVYPHLSRSVVYLDKEKLKMLGKKESDKKKRGQRDFARKKRLRESGKPKKSHKEVCQELVLESLLQSQSFDGFEGAIQSKGLGLYRRGKSQRLEGIIFKKKKYRFKSVGLDANSLRSIEQKRESYEAYQGRVASLSTLRSKEKTKEREK